MKSISAPAEGMIAHQREVKPLVELRVPFELSRQAIDDVERGSDDSDWQPAKDAAKTLAFAEGPGDFQWLPEAGIQGIREGTSNPIDALPADVRDYPDAVAHALSQLRLVGVNGPYSVLLGANEYTALAETRDHGYPVLEHVKRIVDGNLIWAPAIEGAFVVTTRGGDFELNIGQDVSIGYLSHTDSAVRLYLQEDLRFPRPDQRSLGGAVAVAETRLKTRWWGGSRGDVAAVAAIGSRVSPSLAGARKHRLLQTLRVVRHT